MGRRPIYKSDEFFKSTPLVDQIYLDMTAVAHRTGVAPFGIRSPLVHRRDAPSKMREFIASFNSCASCPGNSVQPVGTLHTDGAGEFTSNKFREDLADLLVHKTEAPPEVHALNGVAERAILSIFSQVRSDFVASGAPKGFWPEAAAHAVDILNRTTCPPHKRCTCYEALTGDKPRVMSIWPFGCRAHAVLPTPKRLKTSIDNTSQDGINLGRSNAQPGAYKIWDPAGNRILSASDVWFDETYMPWRKAGDRRIGEPLPVQGDGDSGQPPTLPIVSKENLPIGSMGSLAAEFNRILRQGDPAMPKAHSARLSKRVLVLFSGPYGRPDGLIAELLRRDLSVTAIDSDAARGGNVKHDILLDECYESLLRRIQRGEFVAIFAAPPCSTFSISRFIRSSSAKDGGPPIIRYRSLDQVLGAKDCPEQHKRELRTANKIVSRMCNLLRAAVEVGTEFAIENPADRGVS